MSMASNFSNAGLPVGDNSQNLTYLYGLSDFFAVMFQDTATVNLLMEAQTQEAAQIYSNFLQLTSTLSLEGIQETLNTSLNLCLVKESDKVSGQVNTYRLPVNAQSCNFVANRPFLPTETLDNEADFIILQQNDGSSWIRFARPIDEYAFPKRKLSDGVTQFAFWLVDVEIDNRLISTYYGQLIGLTGQNTTTAFADFVYGLFYMYLNGPRLDSISRGLNLALGIPVARAEETVLSIRYYLETDQYLVICDQNQYVIPYGLEPLINEGDTLHVGDLLSEWVQIKDYTSDGEWWLNLSIPKALIRNLPAGQPDRYATAGSQFDYVMRNYLKSHTFLVKVNVASFKNQQPYSQLSDILERVKPAYTRAIYVWAVEQTDTLDIEETLSIGVRFNVEDTMCPSISRMKRNVAEVDRLTRKHGHFLRFNLPKSSDVLTGDNDYSGNYTTYIGDELINGYINYHKQFRDNTGEEVGIIQATHHRGNFFNKGYRNKLRFNRGVANLPSSVAGSLHNIAWRPGYGQRVVPLYITTAWDMQNKLLATGIDIVTTEWWFEIFGAGYYSQAINDLGIDDLPAEFNPADLYNNYEVFFNRGVDVAFLGREFGDNAFETWKPPQSEVKPGDYLLCVRVTSATLGVYWVTTNETLDNPYAFYVQDCDPLLLTYDMPISRGGAPNGAPFYITRGDSDVPGSVESGAINAEATNTSAVNSKYYATDSESEIGLNYTDKYNATMIINRNGSRFLHAAELL